MRLETVEEQRPAALSGFSANRDASRNASFGLRSALAALPAQPPVYGAPVVSPMGEVHGHSSIIEHALARAVGGGPPSDQRTVAGEPPSDQWVVEGGPSSGQRPELWSMNGHTVINLHQINEVQNHANLSIAAAQVQQVELNASAALYAAQVRLQDVVAEANAHASRASFGEQAVCRGKPPGCPR